MNTSTISFYTLLLFCIPALYSNYHSQYGQDKFIYENYFKNKTDGFFVEIGAWDGVYFSNTYFFGEIAGWKGICVEPQPEAFKELCKNRTALCINACITDVPGMVEFTQVICPSSPAVQMLSGVTNKYDPRHLSRINSEAEHFNGTTHTIELQGYLLTDIMDYYGFTCIDYLSIDIEGGELKILRSIPFDRLTVNVISVENNYGDNIQGFLESKGFKFVKRLGADEIYVKTQFLKKNKKRGT